jgi:hypothetical protein
MKQAKCKLCESVLNHIEDEVTCCKCGEVTLHGIERVVICKKSTDNYVKIEEEIPETKLTSSDLISMLDNMVADIERLPEHAKREPINHYDFCSLLMLLSSIFKAS